MTQKNLSGWQEFGNILWLIFGGFELAILSFIEGLICCVTIIFIPVGLQYFKLGVFFIWPLGKTVQSVKQNGFKMFVNVLWAILAGWEHFIFYSLVGIVYCATIIGIPFGLQMFKVAIFIIAPLGRDFVMPMVPVYQQK